MTALGTCIWLIFSVTCWRCEGLVLAVLCTRPFTSTGGWSRACGPAWSFHLERCGMQALGTALRDFSACICAFLPLQKDFLLFPECCPPYLSLLVSTMSLPGSWSSWGCFQPTQLLGWQHRAWGNTQPGAQPGAADFPSQVVAQCEKCVLLTCLALSACKVVVPINFQK